MLKDRVILRAGAAAAIVVGFASVIVRIDKEPLFGAPPYAGPLHALVSTLALTGVLAGAVFFRSRWSRLYATSSAVALLVFEIAHFFSRLSSMAPRGVEAALVPAVLVGGMVFLCAIPDLLDPSAGS